MSFIPLSLDLTTIDPTAITPKPLEPPYHLFTLAQAGDNEITRRSLYPLVREGVLDDPGCCSEEFERYEDFVTRIYPTSYWLHRETTLLISHGQKWIALSTLAIDETRARTGLTVVSKAYRGTGMASILKQHLLDQRRATSGNPSRSYKQAHARNQHQIGLCGLLRLFVCWFYDKGSYLKVRAFVIYPI
jgi:hypothetical protein